MIKAILVDDEKLSLDLLTKQLHAFPEIEIVKAYSQQTNILEDIKQEMIDVAFLDIELTEGNGLDLAESILSIDESIFIVFVTAHAQHAVKAFEINSIDYLLKPVMPKRLKTTVNRLIEKIKKNRKDEAPKEKIPLFIQCFGEFNVFLNKEPLQFKTAKVKELFAFLFTYMDTYVHRDYLIENIWPNQDSKKAKINLHTCLTYLRKMLNTLGYSNCIKFANQSYILSIPDIHSDLKIFNEAIHSFKKNDIKSISSAEEAISQYTGSYMQWNYYDWANDIAQEKLTITMYLLDSIIEYYYINHTDKALFYLSLQRKLNPYMDKNIQQTMNLLIKKGNRNEAILLYKNYKALLSTDLNIDPDPILINLYQEINK
ncbi:response regulator [Cytobacillus kochii]|uniref:response regulator n=1 Tax=Cytobacillus kochii TaxID=859143 RepID=UPI001CD23CCC|nr:response regulator [Cytobacillus kochii]MCA1024518.1 response regulator [Cytobacillus kochii]MCM3323495.1 response regulator [Cytobacillus kochii]MCM3345890.1 response regulator [Cytobacillus kochii]